MLALGIYMYYSRFSFTKQFEIFIALCGFCLFGVFFCAQFHTISVLFISIEILPHSFLANIPHLAKKTPNISSGSKLPNIQ